MGGYNFLPWDRDQTYLLPPNMKDWLPENHLAYFVIDVVRRLNLRPFLTKFRADGWGRSAFDPELMVTLLVYAYCVGERSSRRIERLCATDVAFRVIAANQQPDHTTIARFRQANEAELGALFVEVLRLCCQVGLVKVGVVVVDGTKINASASIAANRTYEQLQKEDEELKAQEKTLAEKVRQILAEATATDAEENRLHGERARGDELPEELADPKRRLARLKNAQEELEDRKNRVRECKERLEREAREAADERRAEIEQKKAAMIASGKTRRLPSERSPTPGPTARANVTDPESRVMRGRQGLTQAFNAQAAATEEQVIVAAELTQVANDVQQLVPMLDLVAANMDRTRIDIDSTKFVVDCGYWSEDNVKAVSGVNAYIPESKWWKQRKLEKEAPLIGDPPKGASAVEVMKWRLRTEDGRATYKKRAQTIEPIFGQLKDVRGIRRFMRRGFAACRAEWLLICATHNLLKLWHRS